jgi:hypothetical protein
LSNESWHSLIDNVTVTEKLGEKEWNSIKENNEMSSELTKVIAVNGTGKRK